MCIGTVHSRTSYSSISIWALQFGKRWQSGISQTILPAYDSSMTDALDYKAKTEPVARRSPTLHDYPYATARRKCFHKWIVNVAPPGRFNCLYGCLYCYAREAIYSRGRPGVLQYYQGLATLVRRELSGLRLCPPLSISNATDPCQPVAGLRAEVEALVSLLASEGVSFGIVTKGDPAWLGEALTSPQRGHACLAVSIEGPGEVVARLSPRAPGYEARLHAVREMSPVLPTMVRLDPLFPHLLQALYGPEWMEVPSQMLREFAAAGARHIISSTGRLDGKSRQAMSQVIRSVSPEAARRFEREYTYDRSYTSRGYMLEHGLRLELHRHLRGCAEAAGMTYATCQELDATESDSEGLPHCEAFALPFCERGSDGRWQPIPGCTANCHVNCARREDPPCGRPELATYLPYKRRYLV